MATRKQIHDKTRNFVVRNKTLFLKGRFRCTNYKVFLSDKSAFDLVSRDGIGLTDRYAKISKCVNVVGNFSDPAVYLVNCCFAMS